MTPEQLTQTLLKNAANQQLAHFYILNGRNDAPTSHALWVENFIRRYWLEIEKRPKLPSDLKSDADLLWLAPWDEEKQERCDYVVDDLKALVTFMGYRGIQSQRRFVVMEDVHRMNLTVANRLLKTLEEPDGDVTFFWPNPTGQKLLSTLESRAIKLPLSFAKTLSDTQLVQQYQQKFAQPQYSLSQFLEDAKKEAQPLLIELINYETQNEGPAALKQELLTLTQGWKKAQTFNQPVSVQLQWLYTYMEQRFRAGR